MIKGLSRRRSSVDAGSAVVALVLSLTGFFAVLTASSGALRDYLTGVPRVSPPARERVEFVTPRIAPPVPSATARTSDRVAAPAPPVSAPIRVAPASRDTISRIVPSNSVAPSLTAPSSRPSYLQSAPIAPIYGRNPFTATLPPTRAQSESILKAFTDSFAALAARRQMSVAERDSLMRVMATSKVVPGRSPQMPGYPAPGGIPGGGMISAPLFSSGPSPAERKRDSVANAEYLGRLRRLQDRVAARRESLRVADSMSRARP